MAKPRGRVRRSNAQTKLARRRLELDVSQEELAAAVGMSATTYRRLEHNQLTDIPLRALNNCALALGVELEDIVEDQWREWAPFDQRRLKPPKPKDLWRKGF
jgi:transcriptional regulator with XRE-family HTH domain